MKKIISLVITLSLVITMLASVTAFAAVPDGVVVSESPLKVARLYYTNLREAGTDEEYAKTSSIFFESGNPIEVVNDGDADQKGTVIREIQLVEKEAVRNDSTAYTVIEFTIDTPYQVNHNSSTLTEFKAVSVRMRGQFSGSEFKLYCDGKAGWQIGENKLNIVVSWNTNEVFTYVNGYLKQAAKVTLNQSTSPMAIRFQTTFGNADEPDDLYPLYTIKDYSLKNYSDFDPSWLNLGAVKYSYNDETGKYEVRCRMVSPVFNPTSSASKDNGYYAAEYLYFAAFNEDGSVAFANKGINARGNGAGAKATFTGKKGTGVITSYYFEPTTLKPVFSKKFFNAIPIDSAL